MDHREAIQMGATEKYLLGELRGQEREDFEEHFFSCVECAADVKSGALFVSGAKKEFAAQAAPVRVREVAAQPKRAGWFETWLRPQILVPVLAALALLVVYQNVVSIPRLMHETATATAPQTLQSFSLVTQNSRGAAPLKIQVAPSSPFSLYVDIPPGGSYSSYIFEVNGAYGKAQFSVEIPASQAKDTIQVLIPGSTLKPGDYTAEIRGIPEGATNLRAEDSIASFPFSLEFTR